MGRKFNFLITQKELTLKSVHFVTRIITGLVNDEFHAPEWVLRRKGTGIITVVLVIIRMNTKLPG